MKNSVLLRCGSLLLLLLPGLHAGFIKEWQLKETASAPVLVTGRITGVHRIGRVPEDRVSWKAETWVNLADVEVLRSFATSGTTPASGITVPSRQIEVQFLSYGPSVTQFINGYPPPLPDIKSGDIRILPLRENSNPASEPWQLMADSGTNLTIPAWADIGGEPEPQSTARVFLIREFANTLSAAAPGEIALLSGYLLHQTEDLSGELMPLLEAAIGDDRQRWAEIAASLHAAQGIPRPSVADLFAAKLFSGGLGAFAAPVPGRGNLPLLEAALRKLQASPETDNLLIRTWIANAPFNAWGSANSLVEYAGSPVTTDTLRQALRNDLSGSSYIAMVLVRHGNHTILSDAVGRAFRVIDDPRGMGSDFNEVQGAAGLLRDYKRSGTGTARCDGAEISGARPQVLQRALAVCHGI